MSAVLEEGDTLLPVPVLGGQTEVRDSYSNADRARAEAAVARDTAPWTICGGETGRRTIGRGHTCAVPV